MLQKDLSIYKWSEDNNMSLNDKKFEGLRYGLNEQIKIETDYKTPLGKTITIKKTVKDIGVLLSDNCTFNEHINSTVENARNIMSWIHSSHS